MMIYNYKKIIYKIYNNNISNSNNKIFLIVNKTEISYYLFIDDNRVYHNHIINIHIYKYKYKYKHKTYKL